MFLRRLFDIPNRQRLSKRRIQKSFFLVSCLGNYFWVDHFLLYRESIKKIDLFVALEFFFPIFFALKMRKLWNFSIFYCFLLIQHKQGRILKKSWNSDIREYIFISLLSYITSRKCLFEKFFLKIDFVLIKFSFLFLFL